MLKNLKIIKQAWLVRPRLLPSSSVTAASCSFLPFGRHPQPNDAGKGFKLGLKHVVGLAVQFQHGHGHVAAAFVEHVVDVDLACADGGGDGGHHAGLVFVDDEHAHALAVAQEDLREIDGIADLAVLQIVAQLAGGHVGAVDLAFGRGGRPSAEWRRRSSS